MWFYAYCVINENLKGMMPWQQRACVVPRCLFLISSPVKGTDILGEVADYRNRAEIHKISLEHSVMPENKEMFKYIHTHPF